MLVLLCVCCVCVCVCVCVSVCVYLCVSGVKPWNSSSDGGAIAAAHPTDKSVKVVSHHH